MSRWRNGARALWQEITGKRSDPTISLDEWANHFTFNGLNYPFGAPSQTLGHKEEEIGSDFGGLVQGAYRSNGVVFACMLARMLLFSEARFQFRQLRNGRPGRLFGTSALGSLERPWRGATTGDLLTKAIQDIDLAGNFFAARRGRWIRRLRPDWVTVVLGSESDPQADSTDIDAEVVGYLYHPGGRGAKREPVVLRREQVGHFAPIPDPFAGYRGMSWLEPVIREVMADGAASTHKLKFFENGATPNLVVSLDPAIDQETFERWIEKFDESTTGILNAYKTLYLGGGAKAEVVGSNLRQIDFKVTQAAGETRIAAAAGVPPVIVGLSEGLEASTYSNYGQARRRFADGTIRPLWRNFAGSMARLIDVPAGAELWFDDRDVPFIREDQRDAAEVLQKQAAAIKSLIDAGFDADTVVDAVTSNDLPRLDHTGLVSVQLLPPGADGADSNGAGIPEGIVEPD